MTTCERCGRPLSNPLSVRMGMGPVCAKRRNIDLTEECDGDRNDLPFEGDVILVCRDGKTVLTNVPHVWKLRSPTGYGWGYGGSGPADLALNILLLYTDRRTAEALYQQFKWDFIVSIPREGAKIPGKKIRAWLEERKAS